MSEIEAWKNFCQRIEALGERLIQDDFPNEPEDRAEGIAHLADQVACWLGFAIGHTDTTAPFFHRSNDLVTQWGGPNQDNAYHHARIDPKRRYRIRGRMHSCESFVLTLRIDFMHMPEWGTRATLTSRDMGLVEGDDFEIFLGGEEPAGVGGDSKRAWLAIPEEVSTVSLREYYLDWQPKDPAFFAIECLDDVDAPDRIDAASVSQKLGIALGQIENSIHYWNDYMRDHRAKATDNEFAPQLTEAKGLAAARYSFCFWNLEPDQALIVDTDKPEAHYWGLQLATLTWFEQVDPIHRISSINQLQAVPSPDGRIRFVVSHEDPGVANWLDTGQHKNGLMTFRFFWCEREPLPQTRVVRFDQLDAALPSDTPRVTRAQRREEIRARKAHLAWRFRT